MYYVVFLISPAALLLILLFAAIGRRQFIHSFIQSVVCSVHNFHFPLFQLLLLRLPVLFVLLLPSSGACVHCNFAHSWFGANSLEIASTWNVIAPRHLDLIKCIYLSSLCCVRSVCFLLLCLPQSALVWWQEFLFLFLGSVHGTSIGQFFMIIAARERMRISYYFLLFVYDRNHRLLLSVNLTRLTQTDRHIFDSSSAIKVSKWMCTSRSR